MADHQASRDAYMGVEIELPDGSTLRCPALTLSEGRAWFETLMLARHGNPHAQLKLLNEFPAVIVPDEEERDALEQLLPAEIYDLADRFLAYRRPDVTARIRGTAVRPQETETPAPKAKATPDPETKTTASSTSASTT